MLSKLNTRMLTGAAFDNWESTYTTVQTNSADWAPPSVSFNESTAELTVGSNTASLSSLPIISKEYQVFDANLYANQTEFLFVATKPGRIRWVGAAATMRGTEDVQISILEDNASLSGSNITLSNASGYADFSYGVTEYNSSFSAGTVFEVIIDDPGEGEGSGALAAQGPLYIEVVLSYDD